MPASPSVLEAFARRAGPRARSSRRLWRASAWLAALGAAAGCGAPSAPDKPTWADVEPILRGNCTGCHGATAATDGTVGSTVYRMDFFEMTDAVCGEAAQALPTGMLARAQAPLIMQDVTSPPSGGRSRMPPAPGPALHGWERETLQRWAADPQMGTPHRGNRRPQIRIFSVVPALVDKQLRFTAVVDDPDGEPVVGVLKLGDQVLKMDRPGSFAGDVDTSKWPNGVYAASTVLCDGWENVTYDLGQIVVAHP